jgi:hypothetical protein
MQGGADAASPRYIFTLLNALTRMIFNEYDDPLLKYLDDDGQSIEPEWCACVCVCVCMRTLHKYLASDGQGRVL